ncbi:Glucan endo-1,3-beta-glucosidase [Arachis hypogaea]|nr:Glucan endo-1,3-beta-glucosidase [Arachis hypogaea]
MLEPRFFYGALYLFVICWSLEAPMAESGIGVNWGTISSHRLRPTTVVDLLRENKIQKVKLFEAEPDVMRALMGSGIQVMVGIPNEMLSVLSSSPSAADLWVRQNVSSYIGKGGADIRHSGESELITLSSTISKITCLSVVKVLS